MAMPTGTERALPRTSGDDVWDYPVCRAFFDSVQDSVFVLRRSRFVGCNSAALRAFGCATAAELIGKTPVELSPPQQADGRDSAEMASEKIAAAEAGVPQVFLWRYRRPSDGTAVDLEVSLSRVSGGGEGLLVGVARDVTARLRTDESLKQGLIRERDFYQSIVQSSPVLYSCIKPDGRIRAMNDTMLRILGYTADEVIGKDYLTTVVPARERSVLRHLFKTVIETRAPSRQESHVFTRSGRELLCDWQISELCEGGELECLSVSGIDISERRQAEEALRKSEERYSLTLLALNDGLWDWNILSGTLYWSSRSYTLLGYEPDEFSMSYARWRELIHPDDLAVVEDDIRRNHERRSERYVSELRMRTKSGQWIWILARGKVVERDLSGRAVRMVGTHHDITERKQAEAERERLIAEAQAANNAKDRLLAVLSHELRNPLAAIRSGLELLRRTLQLDERARDVVEIIVRNTNVQARLVDDLLDMSRLTQGRVTLRRAPVELGAIVRSAVQSCLADAAQARLSVAVGEAPPVWVDGDAERLQQVVMNLLSNAVKFTPPGGRVEVHLTVIGDKARIVVEDTGIGIDPTLLPRLFRAFEQGPASGAQRAPGLGIGLALVKSLTELHGGRVWAESSGSGEGSRFTVELPCSAAPMPRKQKPFGRPAQRQIKMLLIEDNPDTRMLMAESLEILGYAVVSAESGEAALEALTREPVDVVLADIGLPGMDGYEFLRQAQRMPCMAGRPAFALTGYGQEKDVQRAREVGYAGHFVKPVDLDCLDQQIRKVLAEHAS